MRKALGVGTDGERHELMILRAWLEADAGRGLRVRITRVDHDRPNQPEITAMASIDDVCTLVRRWLETLLEGAATDQADDGAGQDGRE
jgi:hypothetical protein